MKKEKLIPSLIEEENETSLPKRGGRYVSDAEKEEKKVERLKEELRDCNCYCDSCDSHPFHKGEGC